MLKNYGGRGGAQLPEVLRAELWRLKEHGVIAFGTFMRDQHLLLRIEEST